MKLENEMIRFTEGFVEETTLDLVSDVVTEYRSLGTLYTGVYLVVASGGWEIPD